MAEVLEEGGFAGDPRDDFVKKKGCENWLR